MNKRGQLTIFIIIAILIVVLGVLAYLFFPNIQTGFGISTNNPNVFVQNCMEEDTENLIEEISMQGGTFNPENNILYEDNAIEFLCYTTENYVPCVMQKPLLKQHIESEIRSNIAQSKQSCLESLRESFESQGYGVQITSGGTNVEIVPGRVDVKFENVLTLSDSEGSERYEELGVSVNNNLYELVGITMSILNSETLYGDAETTTYMNYYHHLKVEKVEKGDGSTIYILTNRNTGDKFQFASRSIVFPPGI